MKTINKCFLLALIMLISLASCTHDNEPECILEELPDESSPDVLLVKEFSNPPVFDGLIDEVWDEARPLVNTAIVSYAGDRIIPLNGSSKGDPSLEPIDLFEPFVAEKYNFTLRGGHDNEYLYLLLEWEDDTDSKDRQSWYFDPATSQWMQENKYANHKNDKFYEDKFAFMFPIKVNGSYPDGFEGATCAVTCHGDLADPKPGEKTTRHYMKNAGELTDLWHWKRNRNVLSQSVDDGFIQYETDEGMASANGRKSDEGIKMYDDKSVFTDEVTGLKGPKWVKKGEENYYWITLEELESGEAQTVEAVAADGKLTLSDESVIDPNLDLVAYSKGFGSKRFPSITINPGGAGNDFRSDTQVRATHVGSGWQIEIKRKLNSGDPNDAIFEIGQEMKFGMSIFNNAAIGHGMTNLLTLKIE